MEIDFLRLLYRLVFIMNLFLKTRLTERINVKNNKILLALLGIVCFAGSLHADSHKTTGEKVDKAIENTKHGFHKAKKKTEHGFKNAKKRTKKAFNDLTKSDSN